MKTGHKKIGPIDVEFVIHPAAQVGSREERSYGYTKVHSVRLTSGEASGLLSEALVSRLSETTLAKLREAFRDPSEKGWEVYAAVLPGGGYDVGIRRTRREARRSDIPEPHDGWLDLVKVQSGDSVPVAPLVHGILEEVLTEIVTEYDLEHGSQKAEALVSFRECMKALGSDAAVSAIYEMVSRAFSEMHPEKKNPSRDDFLRLLLETEEEPVNGQIDQSIATA